MKQFIGWVAGFSILMLLAMPVSANDWNFYGSARVGTWIEDVDNKGGVKDSTDFNQYLQSNSRIGAKIKVNDNLTARFEYGTGVNVRLLWGEWNFGPGKLLIGQDYTPIYMNYAVQVYDGDQGLQYYGSISEARKPMLQLKFGDFKIAAITPGNSTLNVAGATTEITFPKLEASYVFRFNNMNFKLAGGYNQYEITDGNRTYDVTSYLVGFGGKINFGAAYLAGNIYAGQNLGPYKFLNSPADDPIISNNNLIDNDNMGYLVAAGYKLNDMFAFETGYGYAQAELDTAGSNEDDAASYYLQAQITLAPGVYITPEIGRVDERKDANGNEESVTTYYGVKWQINF